MKMPNKLLLTKIFLLLAAIESMVALFALVSIPADSKNAAFFGFSTARVLLIGVTLVIFLTAASLLAWLHFSRSKAERSIDVMNALFFDPKRQWALAIGSGSIVILGWIFLLTPAEGAGEAVYQRILPLVVLGMLLAFQWLVLQFLWLQQKIHWEQIIPWKRQLSITGIVLLIFTALWALIAWSGIGVRPEPSGWFSPGTPLLAQQVLIAWVAGFAVVFFGLRLRRSCALNKFDYILASLLWLVAGAIWWMEPVQRSSYFTPDPTPPNFEYYPYSDAALYDEFSQNILIGTSRQVGLTNRPLYSLFLALLHGLAGQKFETVIFLQVFILALTMVFVYLLASDLGGRPAGMIAALLLMFREKNSITLTNIIEVSHVKLIMSDVPTMMVMVVFIYFFVRWLQIREGRYYLGALAGAFLGFTILIRSQAQLLIPIALLGIAIAHRDGWRPILRKSLIFLAGLLVVVAPWVWRNYQVSGRMIVEYQEFYTRVIASGYSSAPHDYNRLPGESVEHYDDRMKSLIIDFMVKNPGEVARFYTSYFLHNEISSVAYLPMSPRFNDIYAYVKQIDFWGNTPLGMPPPGTLPMFFFSLVMIAVGIGGAFSRAGWAGLMPLFFHLGYSFSVVPVRMSGWRYILPVDWVSMLYFGIGLVQITAILLALFSGRQLTQLDTKGEDQAQPESAVWKRTWRVLLVSALVGLSIPLVEWSIPERYPRMSPIELVQKYAPHGFAVDDGPAVTLPALETFLETEAGSTVLHGRALYPAYYELGKFWGESSPNLLAASQYDRLQFWLIGPDRVFVYIPLQDAPDYFPHASDVFVVGCMQDGSVRALLIKVNEDLLATFPFRGLTCSGVE